MSYVTTHLELCARLIYARIVDAVTKSEVEAVFHPAIENLRLTRVLAALADPARLAIVRALDRTEGTEGTACVDVWHEAGITVGKSTFSHHQRVLREAGIIHVRVQGTRRNLSLRRDCLDKQFPGLLDSILRTPDDLLE